MNCPHCASATTKEQTKKTALGYRTFCCSDCKQTFNERSGTHAQLPGISHRSRVRGKWCYLYRAIDRDGNLVDTRLSEKRDMEAAQSFFKQALQTVGHVPEQVTTDGHSSYPRAICETLGGDVLHQCSHYLNNIVEQDHRGIKQRYYPMRGFGSFTSAARFCRAFDEIRQFFRCRSTIGQSVSLAQQRDLFHQRLNVFHALI